MNTNGKKAAEAKKANAEAREIWQDLPEEINVNESKATKKKKVEKLNAKAKSKSIVVTD